MKKLLKFELYKLKKSKSIYICSGVILGVLFLNLLINMFMIKVWGGEFFVTPSTTTVVLSSVNAADFNLIAGIFIALYVCGDFSQRTIKNIYSRGFSRAEVFFSKYIIAIAYTVIMYFITLFFAFAVGSMFFGYSTEDGHVFALIVGQLLTCIAYTSLAFSLSQMVKKTGAAVALAILAPIVVSLLLALVDAIINAESFLISNYWLDGILTRLSDVAAETKVIITGCVAPVVYSALFVTAGFFVNREAEV